MNITIHFVRMYEGNPHHRIVDTVSVLITKRTVLDNLDIGFVGGIALPLAVHLVSHMPCRGSGATKQRGLPVQYVYGVRALLGHCARGDCLKFEQKC